MSVNHEMTRRDEPARDNICYQAGPSDETGHANLDNAAIPPYKLLDPGGKSVFYLKLVDTPRHFYAEPGPLPWWIVCLSLLPVLIGSVWYWSRHVGNNGIDAGMIFGLLWSFCALALLLLVLHLLNNRVRSYPPFFILDKRSGTLALPRNNVMLTKSEVVQFCKLRGWHPIVKAYPRETYLLHELVVVHRGDGESLTCSSVVVDGDKRKIARVASQLAEYYSVPVDVKNL